MKANERSRRTSRGTAFGGGGGLLHLLAIVLVILGADDGEL